MIMDAYGDFAYIYDRLMHDDVDYDKWCDYIESLMAAEGCEPDTICELACGTGSITSRLEARGYRMTGVDISADMIEVARKKTRRAEYVCENMARYCPEKKFGACLCMIDGMNYVIAPKLAERVFKNVRGCLEPGGVFIFDVSSRYKLKEIIGDETFIHSEYDVFYSWQNRYTERYNISDMLLNFFVRRGDTYERFEERHLQRAYTERELKVLLGRAGFENVKCFGELTFEPPKPEEQRLVFVCS